LTKNRLRNYRITQQPRLREHCYAGWDLGKKAHPAHFAVFGLDRSQRLVQVHSHFFDSVDYKDQIEYINQAIKSFGIAKVSFDNTRMELEGYIEKGELGGEYEPVVFTSKMKFAMASGLDRRMSNKEILFLKDERQGRHLLGVDNDLKSPTTAEGHGDAFWSVCLSVWAYEQGSSQLLW